jgi:hypothetical protein
MKRSLLLPFLTAPFLAVAPIAAQGDRITWVDGTTTEDCKILQFTVFETKFSARGANESRSTDQVLSIEWGKLDEMYRRATGAPLAEAPGEFLNEAQKRLQRKDLLTAQIGYQKAAELFLDNGQVVDAVAVYDKLAQEIPDSGYAPELFRVKLDHYLAQGKEGARNAASAAATYRETATTKAWPKGFLHEASYYEVLAEAAAGTMQPAELERRMRGVLQSTEGVAPSVANRAKLQIAQMLLLQEKHADAEKIFDDLAGQRGLDANSRAQIWLGTGEIRLKTAAADDKQAYRKALLSFLRAYLDEPNANPELRAKGAFFARTAAEKWGGPDARLIQARMQAILRREFPDSTWAKR